MSRYRLYPTAGQEQQMVQHCAHARYVWNLAVEQFGYRHHRQWTPGIGERSRQLTEARQEFEWLRAGSCTVQQQALRDFDQAMRNWRAGSHKRLTWRKQGQHEGFRIVDGHGIKPEKLNQKWSRVLIPKVGWVKLRVSRTVPAAARSFRVTRDPRGHWFIGFAVAPSPIDGPTDHSVVGVDRGVVVSLACSDGQTFQAPRVEATTGLRRKLSRAKRQSNRRLRAKARLARAYGRDRNRRKDFVEKATTWLARHYDVIRIEDLRVANMTRSAKGTVAEPGQNVPQKAGLNRSILEHAWGMFAERLQDKAPGRVEKVNPAYTSQRCSGCQHVDAKSRKSQALFACTACGHTSNADLNAARNIAAGSAVTARGALALAGAVNREPQSVPHLVA